MSYTDDMSLRRAKSLKNLIFRHEIAILILVAVTGLIGGLSAYFWQQNSAESVRINSAPRIKQLAASIRASTSRSPSVSVLQNKNSRYSLAKHVMALGSMLAGAVFSEP